MKTLILFLFCTSLSFADGIIKICYNGQVQELYIAYIAPDGNAQLYSKESNQCHWYSKEFLQKYQIK